MWHEPALRLPAVTRRVYDRSVVKDRLVVTLADATAAAEGHLVLVSRNSRKGFRGVTPTVKREGAPT